MEEKVEVFTPIYKGKRVTFPMYSVKVLAGNLDVRKLGRKAIVEIDNQVYEVIGRACDLPRCFCDAEIKRIGNDLKTKQD